MAWCSLASSVTPGDHDGARAKHSRRGADHQPSRNQSADGANLHGVTRKLRCAVYTRKSSEEGLDVEFNSLDAFQEACEAYITSQRSGWVRLPTATTMVARHPAARLTALPSSASSWRPGQSGRHRASL